MSELREKRVRTWIPVALIGALLLYPLSFGPACWIASRNKASGEAWVNKIYSPIVQNYRRFPDPVKSAIIAYGKFGSASPHLYIHNYHLTFEIWPLFVCPSHP